MKQRLKTRHSILIAVLILFSGVALTAALISMGEAEEEENPIDSKLVVPVKKIVNRRVRMDISIMGHLEASEKIEIHSEVSGILKRNNRKFLEGVKFRKGETILQIDPGQQLQSLIADRTALLNKLLQLMPDLKNDYPDNFSNWKKYIINFNPTTPLLPFPAVSNRQEKFFLTTNGIYQSYYRTASNEVLLKKFRIKAPFNGMVIESNVRTGSLIQAGQKLGEFITTDTFYLKASVSQKDAIFINPGQKVNIRSEALTDKVIGTVERINNPIDSSTQQISVYIMIKTPGLRQGMFAEGVIETDNWVRGVRIPGHLVSKDSRVDIVKDSKICKLPVDVVIKERDNLIVTGLNDGSLLSLKNEPVSTGTEVDAVIR